MMHIPLVGASHIKGRAGSSIWTWGLLSPPKRASVIYSRIVTLSGNLVIGQPGQDPTGLANRRINRLPPALSDRWLRTDHPYGRVNANLLVCPDPSIYLLGMLASFRSMYSCGGIVST